MERINSNNYEAFFLDYLEGNLAAQQEFELLDFLDKHPHLKAELEVDLGELKLQPVAETPLLKESLKRVGIQPDEVDNLMIASVEGQLSLAELTELNNYIDQHNLTTTYKYYQRTILKPDFSEGYGDRSDLKKKDRMFVPFWMRMAGAAVVGALFIGITVNQFNEQEDEEGTSVVNDIIKAKKEEVGSDHGNSGQIIITENVADDQTTENQIGQSSFIGQTDGGVNVISPDETSPDERVEIGTPDKLLKERESVILKDDPIILKDQDPDTDRDNPANVDSTGQQESQGKDGITEPIKEPKERILQKGEVVTEEPIKVVTDFAGKVLKKDISYERDKETSTGKYVAHHIKLGRFEFERKKR